MTLTMLKNGQSGVVTEIQGGQRLVNRLNALGIRPGKRITKDSSIIMRGPITVDVDRAHVAIGFGMARRIIVTPDALVT